MDLTSYLPALQQHGLLTHRQALLAGLEPRDVAALLRCGTWVRVRSGVYADRQAWDALDPFRGAALARVRAAELVLQADHVLSHDSAALVHGLGVPDPRTCLVHVTRDRVVGSRTKAGIKHHGAPYDPADVRLVDGLRVLSPARTALDMAREHGLGPGTAACDAALRLGATPAELRRVEGSMWSWPQVRVVRRCVELADPGSESWLESLGRVLVAELGRGRPETQFGLTDGRRTVWCDFRVGRQVYEVDGRLKLPDDDPKAAADEMWKAKLRQDFIVGFGLGMSRITHHDCHAGREAARRRLAREAAATEARFGRSIDDLAAHVVRGRAPYRRM